MKRTSRLLGLGLALCLLLSLLSLPTLAERVTYTSQDLAGHADKEDFAITGGWPPELVGCWVGDFGGTWGCWSFYPDGRHRLTNFDYPGINMTGTSKTIPPAEELAFETTAEGDLMYMTGDGNTGKFRKVSIPWIRLEAEEETAAAGVDPAILGTYSGRLDGLYIEWTFHGDGRFTQVTPVQELTEHGTYLAGNGNLVILLNGKIINGSYKVGDSLHLQGLPDANDLFMQPKTGPLVQIPDQWRPDSPRAPGDHGAAYREEFAETGGWPPENIGSWVGQDFMDLCGQFSFYPDGRYTMTVFEQPSYNSIGTSKTLEAADKGYVEGDIMHLEDNGSSDDLRRLSMPYARMKAEKETAAAGVDPAILGTYGGRLDGLYTEWTFHGDGRLTQVTPLEESTIEGTYLTGDGNLAIFLNGKIINYPYIVRASSLSLTYPDAFKVLQEKAGPLVQVPEQWNIQ